MILFVKFLISIWTGTDFVLGVFTEYSFSSAIATKVYFPLFLCKIASFSPSLINHNSIWSTSTAQQTKIPQRFLTVANQVEKKNANRPCQFRKFVHR